MARRRISEPDFTDTDEAVPSDTMLAHGSEGLTASGDTAASTTRPTSSGRDAMETLPTVSRDHYAIGAPFAKGGIGQISAAMDRRLGRRVAIKELRRHSRYTQLRFAREINITAKLQHPNIVQLHEAGRWPDGEPFFAMKLVDGDSLEGAIDSCVTLKDHLHLVRHVADVADAMAHAHSRRIVHRDLKPGNVLVGPFGETVVIDWGLAKDLAEDDDDDDLPVVSSGDTVTDRYRTTEGVVLGTPSYMPPEQAAGRPVDERADVYALGAIMYQALCGRTPYFEYHPKRVLERVVAAPPTPLAQLQPGLPKDLLAIVDKAMARDPAQRYRTAANMAEELHRFTTGRLVAAYDYSFAELVRRFVQKHRAAVTTAVVGALLLVGFGAWSFRRIATERDTAELARSAEHEALGKETQARADAERRFAEALLTAARSDLDSDPTRAVARLKQLQPIIAGAATVAADAAERGVALRVLSGHTDRIDVVTYSPDGRWMASSGVDGVIRVLRRDTQAVTVLDRHRARVPAIAFAGDQLISADYEGKTFVWDVSNQKVVHELATTPNKEVRAIAVSADGSRVATVAEDAVVVWELASGKAEMKRVRAVERSAFAVFVPGSARLVTGGHQGELAVWDLAGDADLMLTGHDGEVHDAAVSPDGAWVVSAGDDGTVRRWDLADGAGTIVGRHDNGARVVRFFDASRVVSGGMDGRVVMHDFDRGASRVIAHHEERVSAISTHSARWVASAGWDKRTVLHDHATGSVRQLRGHGSVVSSLAFVNDGSELASASWDRTVRLWANDSTQRLVPAHGVGVKTVAFDAQGKRVASGGHDDVVRVWEANTGKLVVALTGHSDHVFRVIFSPDGQHVASSSDDRTVRLWRIDDGHVDKLEGHGADVEELAFAANGKWLASASEDKRIGLWRVGETTQHFLDGHEQAVTAVSFMPDDSALVSASLDGTVAFWSVPDGQQKKRAVLHAGGVSDLSVAANGLVATVGRDDRVMLWDGESAPRLVANHVGADRVSIARDGSQVAFSSTSGVVGLCHLVEPPGCRMLVGHEERVAAMHFSDDNAVLVTGSEDGTLRIWSTVSGESRPLRLHHAPVFDVAIQGDRIASASGDGLMGLFLLAPPPAPTDLRLWLDRMTAFVLPADVDPRVRPN